MKNYNMINIGPIEIQMPSGETFYTEVCKDGDTLVTGTFTNTGLLRDPWEVDIRSHFGSLQEALQELYEMLEDYCTTQTAMEVYA